RSRLHNSESFALFVFRSVLGSKACERGRGDRVADREERYADKQADKAAGRGPDERHGEEADGQKDSTRDRKVRLAELFCESREYPALKADGQSADEKEKPAVRMSVVTETCLGIEDKCGCHHRKADGYEEIDDRDPAKAYFL